MQLLSRLASHVSVLIFEFFFFLSASVFFLCITKFWFLVHEVMINSL
ncbi:hypothetical protein OIU76_030648 [Salix suchowensis]|nr:hypothetical protein OIU76_030648 [Salix suchowensis]